MIAHVATVVSPVDSMTWVFYDGTQSELATLRAWVEARFASQSIHIGTQDVISLIDFGTKDHYRQGFAFVHRKDAMRFRLSW